MFPTIHNDASIGVALAKISYAYNPGGARYKVPGFHGFGTDELGLFVVAMMMKRRRNHRDKIVFFGQKTGKINKVEHCILVDVSNHVVADAFKNTPHAGVWKRGQGYYDAQPTGRRLFMELDTVGYDAFLVKTQHSIFAPQIISQKTAQVASTEVLSKLAIAVTTDFIRCMYMLYWYMYNDAPIKPELAKASKQWSTGFRAFLDRFELNTKPFIGLLNRATKNAPMDATAEDYAQAIAEELAYGAKDIKAEIDIPHEQLALINSFRTLFKNDSPAAQRRLNQGVTLAKSTEIMQQFAKHTESDVDNGRGEQSAYATKAKALAKKQLGDAVLNITPTQALEWRTDNPETYKQFNKLRRMISQVAKDYIRYYVRNSGKEYVPYSTMVKELEAKKITHHLPRGFIGNIDADGTLRTTAGLAMGSFPNVEEVRMNPRYDAEADNAYVFRAGSNNYYTVSYRKNATQEKYALVKDMEDDMPGLQKKWRADMKSGSGRKHLLAAGLELIYQTSGRTGNKGNATAGQTTYGITTLLVSHVKVTPTLIEVKYPGKNSTINHFKVPVKTPETKLLAAIIQDQMEGKQPDDLLWTYQFKPIPTQAFSIYFTNLGSHGTLHKVRTMRGTSLARQLLAEVPFKKGKVSQTEVENWYKEEMKKVGNALSHQSGDKETGMTAIKSYIDIGMQKEFFRKLGLRTPKFLETRQEREV